MIILQNITQSIVNYMKSYIFIPARIGATRLRNKPILMIGNKPMLCHVIDRAKEANVCEIVVATDSEEIKTIVENYNTKCVMTSPDHPSGTDRIFDALRQIDPDKKVEKIINLQGDMPFISPKTIKTIYDFGQTSHADINTLAVEIDENRASIASVVKPAIAFEASDYGKALYFSRAKIPYNGTKFYEHLGIYTYNMTSLEKFINLPPSPLELTEKLEQLRALENNMTIKIKIVCDNPKTVDTSEDLEIARAYFDSL